MTLKVVKRFIACLLIFCMSGVLPICAYAENACADGEAQARVDVPMYHSSTGWGIGGFASGMALGLIGTGIIWLAASGTNPDEVHMKKLASDKSSDFINCYHLTYRKESKKKNKSAALTGGCIGTLVFLLIVLSSSDSE